jgi:hypothetical protein
LSAQSVSRRRPRGLRPTSLGLVHVVGCACVPLLAAACLDSLPIALSYLTSAHQTELLSLTGPTLGASGAPDATGISSSGVVGAATQCDRSTAEVSCCGAWSAQASVGMDDEVCASNCVEPAPDPRLMVWPTSFLVQGWFVCDSGVRHSRVHVTRRSI